MKRHTLTAAVMFAATMVSAQASSFDCVQPDLPDRSTTNESVRRVQKQIFTWYSCYADFTAGGHATKDAERAGAEVDARIAKWIDNTRAHSRRNRSVLANFENERAIYLRDVVRGRTVSW